MSNDFYVSLPSNASMKNFPENKQSNYTTLLESPIVLNKANQVALVEISNFSNFKVDAGNISFENPFSLKYESRTQKITFQISFKNGLTLKQFCDTLNYEIERNFIKIEYNDRYKLAYDCDPAILELNYKLNVNKKNNEIKPKFNVIKTNSRYEIIDKYWSVFRDDFFKADGKYDLKSNRFYFESLDKLEKIYDLLVITAPEYTEKYPETDNKIYYFKQKN
jgi:hypothetical protein